MNFELSKVSVIRVDSHAPKGLWYHDIFSKGAIEPNTGIVEGRLRSIPSKQRTERIYVHRELPTSLKGSLAGQTGNMIIMITGRQ